MLHGTLCWRGVEKTILLIIYRLSGGDLAFSLGFETLQNLKQARAHLQEAA